MVPEGTNGTGTLLVVSEKGMGKRSAIDDYRLQGRGGKGVINLKLSEKTGKVVGIKSVEDDDELVLITRHGVVNRQAVSEIRVIGRNTQGVRLMSLDQGDEVVDIARLVTEAEEAGLTEGDPGDGIAGTDVPPEPAAGPDAGEDDAGGGTAS